MNIVDLFERERRRLVSDLTYARDARDFSELKRMTRRLEVFLAAQQRVVLPVLGISDPDAAFDAMRLATRLRQRAEGVCRRCHSAEERAARDRGLHKLERDLNGFVHRVCERLHVHARACPSEHDALGGRLLLALAGYRKPPRQGLLRVPAGLWRLRVWWRGRRPPGAPARWDPTKPPPPVLWDVLRLPEQAAG